jgi:hypothetical protein
MSASTTLSVDFGVLGGASRRVAIGWSFAERDFTWTLGEESIILLDRPQEPGDYMLRITCNPALEPDRGIPVQRVYVLVNRWYAGTQLVDHHGTYDVRVGWDVIRAHAQLSVGLLLPDAYRPCDVADTGDARQLALAVFNMTLQRIGPPREQVEPARAPQRPAAPTPALAAAAPAPVTVAVAPPAPPPAAARPAAPAAFPFLGQLPPPPAAEPAPPPQRRTRAQPLDEQMLEFESLGADAEFGLVQRQSGAEPLGLLRFAEVPLDRMLTALDADFAELGAPGTVEITLRGREFMLRESRYGMQWHSWTFEGQANPQQVLEREVQRLEFLRSKLLADLAEGHKLLVYKRAAPLTRNEVQGLLATIRRHGPSMLLLVQEADAAHADGTVAQAEPGLLRGYVSRFAAEASPEAVAVESWVAMAQEAHRIWQAALVGG